jgi:molybdopterin-guanine dinucleotide biosynthesis protein A
MSRAEQQTKSSNLAARRIAVILAGGQSMRMGRLDKARIGLDGDRLIDRVIQRLSPQVDEVLIAGPENYETGLFAIEDRRDGPSGPAAGLWSAMHWIAAHEPKAAGFATAPVDGPFAPLDLYQRLASRGSSAVACDAHRLHPTFAYWRIRDLQAALKGTRGRGGVSLDKIAERCAAERVAFSDPRCFINLNAPEDIAQAAKSLRGDYRNGS